MTIDPFTLPSLPLGRRSELPDIVAVYFAVCGSDVLYIGQTSNLKKRWAGSCHHRVRQLERYQDVRLAWLETTLNERRTIERNLIRQLDPALNRRYFTLDENQMRTMSQRLSQAHIDKINACAQRMKPLTHGTLSTSAVIRIAIEQFDVEQWVRDEIAAIRAAHPIA